MALQKDASLTLRVLRSKDTSVNVLILNLTRFGDLIQTQPVISGYAALGHRVGLVCLANFASAATLLHGVDAVFPFPGAGLLAGLDANWRTAVRDVAAFMAEVVGTFGADRVVNLTPSVSSRLLTRPLAPSGAEVAGFSVDQFGFNADTSSWAAFLQMAGANRGASLFNVCDIFRRTAGLADEGNALVLKSPESESQARADALLAGHDFAEGERAGFIALQMGASEDRRRWPVDAFVQLARRIWERDRLVPVLLGTRSEATLGERFREAASCPSIDLMGRTSLLELSAVLTRCRALVTNDTGTMHLAAGLGVSVCAVFLATAQPWDTGPYRVGSICLEPDMACHPCAFGAVCPRDHACRRTVTPEAMDAAVRQVLDGEGADQFPGARAWRTVMTPDGFMGLTSLSGHGETDRSLWITIQRACYLPFLDGRPMDAGTGLGRRLSPDLAAGLSKTLTSARDMLFLLTQQGMLLARNPRPQAKGKFLASWQRLQNLLAADDSLNILGLMWMFESQRCGDDLASLLGLIERYMALFASLDDEISLSA
jgi:ADP-heptose:LPS heptosyltransferase